MTQRSSDRLRLFSACPTPPVRASRQGLRALTLAILAVALSGCNAVSQVIPDFTPNFTWVHRIDIQQGAVITREMAEQLKPGMTRDQVRFVLGTPPIADLFHADRWDYPYTMQRRGGPIERRNFTVLFEENRLKSFGGDPLPSEREFDQQVVDNRTGQNNPPATNAPATGTGKPTPANN